MKINWFKLLILVSLVFLGVYLYRNDLLTVPVIYKKLEFAASVFLLLLSFFLQAINWRYILRNKLPISIPAAFNSIGLSVFTKYIPGKVAVVIGPPEYLSQKYDYSRNTLIPVALESQILSIWTGLLVGTVSLFFLKTDPIWITLSASGIVALGVILFYSKATVLFSKSISFVLRKKMQIPRIDRKVLLRSIPLYLLYWVVLSTAFYFMANSLVESTFELKYGFCFPLATTLGILAVFAPGGIGIREGALFLFLGGTGILTVEEATGIAVFSRLWFLIGESLLFLSSLILHKFN